VSDRPVTRTTSGSGAVDGPGASARRGYPDEPRGVSRRVDVARQVTVGGLASVALAALTLGVIAARLSVPRSAFIVAVGVTGAAGLIGGFLTAPHWQRLAARRRPDHHSSPLRGPCRRRP
jgi:hypothetical protein